MKFDELPLQTQLQLVINDLSSCHVLGADAMRFGAALNALENAMSRIPKEESEKETKF